MDLTGRPPRRSVMARWRAANSSCMGASVVRPLAVAHGGHSSRTEEGKKALGAVEACPPDREWSDQLSGRFQRRLSDQLSEKAERSTVGSHLSSRSVPSNVQIEDLLFTGRKNILEQLCSA